MPSILPQTVLCLASGVVPSQLHRPTGHCQGLKGVYHAAHPCALSNQWVWESHPLKQHTEPFVNSYSSSRVSATLYHAALKPFRLYSRIPEQTIPSIRATPTRPEVFTYAPNLDASTGQRSKGRLSSWSRCLGFVAPSCAQLDMHSSNAQLLQQ